MSYSAGSGESEAMGRHGGEISVPSMRTRLTFFGRISSRPQKRRDPYEHGAPCCHQRPREKTALDDGGVFRIASRSLGRARSTREKVADVHCGDGSGGARCLSLADYVMETGATRGATAAGGC
jgi:hypothetical protein